MSYNRQWPETTVALVGLITLAFSVTINEYNVKNSASFQALLCLIKHIVSSVDLLPTLR